MQFIEVNEEFHSESRFGRLCLYGVNLDDIGPLVKKLKSNKLSDCYSAENLSKSSILGLYFDMIQQGWHLTNSSMYVDSPVTYRTLYFSNNCVVSCRSDTPADSAPVTSKVVQSNFDSDGDMECKIYVPPSPHFKRHTKLKLGSISPLSSKSTAKKQPKIEGKESIVYNDEKSLLASQLDASKLIIEPEARQSETKSDVSSTDEPVQSGVANKIKKLDRRLSSPNVLPIVPVGAQNLQKIDRSSLPIKKQDRLQILELGEVWTSPKMTYSAATSMDGSIVHFATERKTISHGRHPKTVSKFIPISTSIISAIPDTGPKIPDRIHVNGSKQVPVAQVPLAQVVAVVEPPPPSLPVTVLQPPESPPIIKKSVRTMHISHFSS